MTCQDSINTTVKRKGNNSLNTEKFIIRSRAKHGDRYDYSKSIYTTAKEKLIIICKIHGDFEQTSSEHMYGANCQMCSANKRLTKEIFTDRANKVHNFEYDYSDVIYERSSKKVKIRCKKHGIFEQQPSNHLNGNKCPTCVGRRNTTKSTIERLINARGKRYDYSKVVYTRSDDKIKIICHLHGEFEQNIWQHIHGANCQKCSMIEKTERQKHDFNELVNEFNNTHNFAYDYSNSVYINIDKPIEITCKKHGKFMQAPYHHRKVGAGCPKCTKATPYSRSKYIRVCDRYGGKSSLYIIKLFNDDECFYKVGITVKTVKQRFNRIPYKIEELKIIVGDGGYIFDLETQLHKILSNYHYKPKNNFGGSKLECFSKIPKSVFSLVDSINKTSQLQLIA